MTSFAHPPDQLEPARTTPDPRSHLLDHTSLDAYRQGVADGVERVARRIGTADGPVTGVTAAELQRHGFSILRERAAIGYHAIHYAAGSPYTEMAATLWRESPVPLLAEGERLATMAPLLHCLHVHKPTLPPDVERIQVAVPEELHTAGLLDEDTFWATVAACVAAQPHSDALFADRFALSCLNRLQLRDNKQVVAPHRPGGR